MRSACNWDCSDWYGEETLSCSVSATFGAERRATFTIRTSRSNAEFRLRGRAGNTFALNLLNAGLTDTDSQPSVLTYVLSGNAVRSLSTTTVYSVTLENQGTILREVLCSPGR